MKLKVTYQSETHRIAQVPETLQSLTTLISDIFLSPLPPHWGLEYNDLNGNKMALTDQNDYKDLIAAKPDSNSAISIVRLSVVPKKLEEKPKVPSVVIIELEECPPTEVVPEKELKNTDDLIQFAPVLSNHDFKYAFPDTLWDFQEVQEPIKQSNQDFEDLIDKAIEKRISKIASMTQEYISEKSYKQHSQIHVDPQEQSNSHMGVTCCGCLTTPISGIRYKCSICPSFDYCENCENTRDHPHALIKIKSPQQPYLHAMTRMPPPPPFFMPFPPFMTHPQPFMSHPSPFMNHPNHPPPFMSPPQPFMQPTCQTQGKPNFPFLPTMSYPNPFNMNQKPFPEQGMDFTRPHIRGMCDSPMSSSASQSFDEVKQPMMNVGASSTAKSFVENLVESKTAEKNKEKGLARKSYSKAVLKKARHMLQMMPDANYDALLKFVDGCPKDMDTIEMLVAFDLSQELDKH